ncbi:MAG: hypothetical protein ABSG42_07450 [Nitrospirota bacterium]
MFCSRCQQSYKDNEKNCPVCGDGLIRESRFILINLAIIASVILLALISIYYLVDYVVLPPRVAVSVPVTGVVNPAQPAQSSAGLPSTQAEKRETVSAPAASAPKKALPEAPCTAKTAPVMTAGMKATRTKAANLVPPADAEETKPVSDAAAPEVIRDPLGAEPLQGPQGAPPPK